MTNPPPSRPILFSAPMVRALLAGHKSVTRRVVNPQPNNRGLWSSSKCQSMVEVGEMGGLGPYGWRGDELYVKETWRTAKAFDAMSPTAIGEKAVNAGYSTPWGPVMYLADGATNGVRIADFGGEWGRTRVSIHMPRWASRLHPKVIDVRVERMNITDREAILEGVHPLPLQDATDPSCWWTGDVTAGPDLHARTAAEAFRKLWIAINGEESWDANPWVWRVEMDVRQWALAALRPEQRP